MRIDHCGLDVAVSEQLLKRHYRSTALHKQRRIGVPQTVPRSRRNRQSGGAIQHAQLRSPSRSLMPATARALVQAQRTDDSFACLRTDRLPLVQRVQKRIRHRHRARNARLGLAAIGLCHRQHRARQIHILSAQSEDLACPQPREQPEPQRNRQHRRTQAPLGLGIRRRQQLPRVFRRKKLDSRYLFGLL